MLKLKNLIKENDMGIVVPVEGVVAEFIAGVNEMARLSPDGAFYRNDIGFNGTHAVEYNKDSQYFRESGRIPLPILVKWINAMKTYKNTQNPYNRPYDSLVTDLRNVLGRYFSKPEVSTSEKVVKLTNRPDKYGKKVVYITDGERVFPRNRKWLAALKSWFDANGIGEEQDSYGNWKLPIYKYFSKDKNSIDGNVYEIRPELFGILGNFFKQNYPEYKVELDQSSVPAPLKPKEKLKIVFGKESGNLSLWKPENGWVMTKLSKELGIYGKGSMMAIPSESKDPYTGKPDFFYTGIWRGKEAEIIEKLDKDGTYDTLELKKYVEQQKNLASTTSEGSRFSFNIVQSNIYVKPIRRKAQDPEAYDILKDMIKFGFPVWQEDRDYNRDSYSHVIKSKDLNQLFSFYALLKRNGLDEDAGSISDIINNFKKSGALTNTYIDGILDGYKNDTDGFYRDVNDTTKINLYPKQMNGVRHLYSRRTALLGDETGVGKTAQVIAAANLRMEHSGGKTLIITLKSVQKQWAQEIVKFIGGNRDEISFDGTNPKKWTILYYENFQAGKQKKDIIATTKKTDYIVLAFDEVHKIKHSGAQRSRNLQEATSHIPYKWGASATMAANKPFDIKNQLKMLGHRMGDVSDGWFKREFAGMVPEGHGGAYVEGNRDKQIEAAIQFRKWLADSGIYIRRSKKEIRSDMPDLDRSTVEITFSDNEIREFYNIMNRKLENAKDPDMALTKLLAARQAVAHQKVPYTVKRAREIVENGEKLVIFTSFIEPGREIVKQLTSELQKINRDYKVGVYTSDSKDRFAEKERFMKNPMVKALVMSIKIGGTGVDFPNGVNHMIVNDFDWTPEQAEQSEGRIFRINSADNKTVEYMISENTIDAEIFDMVSKKREIADILQTDLTQAYQNPKDRKTAEEIYDAMVQMKNIDQKLVDMGRKVGSNKPQL